MLYTEWKLEDALAGEREDAREDGLEKGRKEILELIDAGYTIEALKERLMGNKSAENE
jgi:hypothetical protein